ncbi:MAG: hypothetical protein ABFS42_09340 [Candidatus Krumholzibacteriota bacterium]
MYQSWVDATRIRQGTDEDIWAVDYTAHPLLDPDFATKGSRLLYLTRLNFRRIVRDEEVYQQELARIFHPQATDPANGPSLADLVARTADYLREADIYLASTIELLPSENRAAVLPLPLVTDCNDVRDLMGIAIHGEGQRLRYEARRKLCLAQMLIQIDQSRIIQDGPDHKARFEEILNEDLWRFTKQIHDLTVGYRLSEDGFNIDYTSRPAEGDTRWDFRSTFVEKTSGRRSIALDILYYNCRFKRSVTPISFEIVDGSHRVIEKIRWGDMRQETSGSVLSKMIRKGINNPDEIGDIIGAMFIVNDNDALTDLLVLLDSCVGTPFGWRNVTDTLGIHPGGSSLNTYSSKGFKVFKGDVDVLTEEDGGGAPYRFPVEIQIFTLESYLRTVCGTHDASHLALKLRQFLFGLVPKIFPRKIYGSEWLKLDNPAAGAGKGRP